jgi:hypothetical protein
MKTPLLIVLTSLLLSLGGLLAGELPSGKELAPLALPVECDDCLSYDFIDLRYGINDFGTDFHNDGEFYEVGFTKSLGRHFYFNGSYAGGSYRLDTFLNFTGVDTDRYRFGLGHRRKIADCVDLTFEGGLDHMDVGYDRCGCMDFDSWGYYVGPGIRARKGRLEMYANGYFTGREGDYSQRYLGLLTPAALGVDEDGWLFAAGLIYHLTEHVGLTTGGQWGELDDAYTFGVRFEF